VRNLAIDWTASSLNAASKLRFRYTPRGYDPEWVLAGQRRSVCIARSAGRYRFKVSANTTASGPTGDSWEFSVDAAVLLSAWFHRPCGAVGTDWRGLPAAWWLRLSGHAAAR
jgi:hypothetical protein